MPCCERGFFCVLFELLVVCGEARGDAAKKGVSRKHESGTISGLSFM